MANAFNKEEIVFFESVIAGFDPNNITARKVSKFKPPSTDFERSALKVWRPTPYIPIGKEGLVLASFADRTQLAVPSELNANDSAPSDIKNVDFNMNAVQLNDRLQRDRLAEAAVQQLSAIADQTIATEIAMRGTLVQPTTGAIDSYTKVAAPEELMSIRDVPLMAERCLIMNPTDYNTVAGDLAQRDAPPTGVSLTAYERSQIPRVATFDSFKANFMPTVQAATATGYLVNGANQDHTPRATDVNGNNVDNRVQVLSIDTGANAINVGDCFTIAGVFAVSHINKNVTPQLQTFRVVESTGGTGTQDITISPAIVVNGGAGGQASNDYANCSAIPADNAALTFINTVSAPANIFFMNDAVEIVHGSLATMDLDGAGVATMRMATDSGIEILFAKGATVADLKTEYRLTMWMRGNVLVPEMAGVLLANQ